MRVSPRFALFLTLAALSVVSCSQESPPDGANQPAEVPRATKEPDGASVHPANEKSSGKGTTVDAKPASAPTLLPRELIQAGWISLFDGETLFGWLPTTEGGWKVADGAVKAGAEAKSFLMTTFELADYEFQCDFKLEKNGNSGIFLRTVFEPKSPATDCYELNLCDSHPEFPTGSIVARKKPSAEVTAEGDWKTLHVRVEGTRITAELDGKPMTDFTDESSAQRKSGHIGLQANGGAVAFRNIRLRPLGTAPLFNGKDLSGWHAVPGSTNNFKVRDGVLHVAGGPGFLESDRQWKDFVLQAEFRTNGTNLNSGIFFRAMPGTEKAPSNGYEFQIHFGFKNGDRAQPMDHGTGAIFRRAPARWIAGNDNEWVPGTLIANGPHFSTWVNGYQVVDWTDERKPHENPRQGQRLERGHLILQGHDDTTNLDFRNIHIAEIPGRDEQVKC